MEIKFQILSTKRLSFYLENYFFMETEKDINMMAMK